MILIYTEDYPEGSGIRIGPELYAQFFNYLKLVEFF